MSELKKLRKVVLGSEGSVIKTDEKFSRTVATMHNEDYADLFTSAPELLSALENMYGIVKGQGDVMNNISHTHMIDQAKQAIEKAKGGSK